MSRTTVAWILTVYFAILIAFTSITQAMFPPKPSAWAAHLAPMSAYERTSLAGRAGLIVGAAATVFVISGIIPLIVWAFWRFKAKHAWGPLILWAGLAGAYCCFMYVGSNAEFRQSPEGITTTGRDAFIQGSLDSCAESRKKDQGATVNLMHTEPYCRCFAEHAVDTLTLEELHYFNDSADLAPQIREKIKTARDTCVHAVIVEMHRSDFVTNCASSQNRMAQENHVSVTAQKIGDYCTCAADKVFRATPYEEIRDMAQRGSMTAAFQERIRQASISCTPDDEWKDVK